MILIYYSIKFPGKKDNKDPKRQLQVRRRLWSAVACHRFGLCIDLSSS